MVKIADNLRWVEKALIIFLILFGLYLLVQIGRKIVGGSWGIEEVILGMLFFNTGAIFTIGIMLAQLKADHNHFKSQFRSLAEDFKAFKARVEQEKR